jgi:hypothetical protein
MVTTSAGTVQRMVEPNAKVVSPVWNLFSFLGAQEAKAWE